MNIEKERRAIAYLRNFQPPDEPYYLCYSGGKDSDTILILASLAGVNFEPKHNLTTVDEPETIKYVKARIGAQNIEKPDTTMWRLIVEKQTPPTRIARYCCEAFKEKTAKGKIKVTGVRWSESNNRAENADVIKIIGKQNKTRQIAEETGVEYSVTRQGGLILNDDNDKNRRFVERCYRTTSTMINPIVDWTDEDVWDFLYYYGCRGNPLYEVEDTGKTFKCGNRCRIGCVACPMKNRQAMKADLIRLPKFRDNYLRAFDRMLKAHPKLKSRGIWFSARDVMIWWVGDDPRTIKDEPEYLRGACL